MSEVVVDGHNGLLFAPADAEALAAQLMRVVDEPGLIDRLAQGTTDHRSVADGVDELLELYAELGARSLTPA
jgi:glycosyltransferase involved in cell wall biosynthesis